MLGKNFSNSTREIRQNPAILLLMANRGRMETQGQETTMVGQSHARIASIADNPSCPQPSIESIESIESIAVIADNPFRFLNTPTIKDFHHSIIGDRPSPIIPTRWPDSARRVGCDSNTVHASRSACSSVSAATGSAEVLNRPPHSAKRPFPLPLLSRGNQPSQDRVYITPHRVSSRNNCNNRKNHSPRPRRIYRR